MLDNVSWGFESSSKLAWPVTVSAVPAAPPSSVTASTPLSVTSSEAMVAAPPTSKVPPLTPTASPAELASVPVKRAVPPMVSVSLTQDRKRGVEGKGVDVGVNRGGRRNIKKKTNSKYENNEK